MAAAGPEKSPRVDGPAPRPLFLWARRGRFSVLEMPSEQGGGPSADTSEESLPGLSTAWLHKPDASSRKARRLARAASTQAVQPRRACAERKGREGVGGGLWVGLPRLPMSVASKHGSHGGSHRTHRSRRGSARADASAVSPVQQPQGERREGSSKKVQELTAPPRVPPSFARPRYSGVSGEAYPDPSRKKICKDLVLSRQSARLSL